MHCAEAKKLMADLVADELHIGNDVGHFLGGQGDGHTVLVGIACVLGIVHAVGRDANHRRGRIKLLPSAVTVAAVWPTTDAAAGKVVAHETGAHRVEDKDLEARPGDDRAWRGGR